MSEQVFQEIYKLSEHYSLTLRSKINNRILEMEADNTTHYLLYRVLGISSSEGKMIDEYQNTGRFLYKYAGAFLEEAAFMCFQFKNQNAKKTRIPNTLGQRPKTFEIDCLIDERAYEIKWRDATTDGDHITKEHTRVKNIKAAGYVPVRVMFYYPNRSQAIKIQQVLEDIYKSVGGEYYFGDSAWEYMKRATGIDLLNILHRIAEMKTDL